MTKIEVKKLLTNLIHDFHSEKKNKYKLIVFVGLLGDFDSFEYAINLGNLIRSNEFEDTLDIYSLAIGNNNGKEKFCNFTGLPKKCIQTVLDNQIHNDLGISRGLDIGLGGWINTLLMLSGVNSIGTIKEVVRGYIGDKNAYQIYKDNEKINLFNTINFSGHLFKRTCGEGYLRPFELATFRLKNMIEIINN